MWVIDYSSLEAQVSQRPEALGFDGCNLVKLRECAAHSKS